MTTSQPLFDDAPIPQRPTASEPKAPAGQARVLYPNRDQIELRPSDLESLLPEGHRARIVWGYVIGQDLSDLYAKIKAWVGGGGTISDCP